MRIFLIAYQNNNFGDDLMIRHLCESFPEHQFEISSKGEYYYKNFTDIKNLSISPYTFKQLSKVKPCPYDMVIKIGGSMFILMRRGSIKVRIFESGYLRKIRKNGCKFVTIGCNLGPFCNFFAKWVAIDELKQNSLITVRDKASFDFLNKYTKSVNRKFYPDILLSLDIKPQDIERSGMCVSVYGDKRMDLDAYCKKTAEAVCLYCDKTGECVKLLCFEDDKYSDIASANKIKELCGERNVSVIIHEKDGSEIIKTIAESRFIIASRFHSMIISMLCATPIVPVIYSDKSENMLSDMGYTGARFYLDKIETVQAHELLKPQEFYPKEFIEKSSGHITSLRQYIDGIAGVTDGR